MKAATLLIVGAQDPEVIDLNRQAQARLSCVNKLVIAPGATHLFEEPGALAGRQQIVCDNLANIFYFSGFRF